MLLLFAENSRIRIYLEEFVFSVYIQRLYSAQLGSILSVITNNSQCFIEENCIFVNDKQASLVLVNTIKDSTMFHIIFPKIVDADGFQPFDLNQEQEEQFTQHCLNCFDQLTKSIFLETRRDNI